MTDSRRLRILHLITDLDIGGAETMLARLIANMDRQNFDNIVVSMLDGGVLRSAVERDASQVTSLAMRRGIPNPMAILQLRRLLKIHTPDVLQTWLYHADLLGVLVRGRLPKARLVWNVRASQLKLSTSTALIRRVLAHLSHLPDAIIFNSKAGQRAHESVGYRPRRAEVIPNGVDCDQFRPDRNTRTRLRIELGLPPDILLIGLVARYDRVKNHATFLKAAGLLARTCGDVAFMAVGRGVEKDNRALMKEVAAEHLDGRLHMLGERTDMHRVMAALDIATSASSGEGFPTVVAEAMACGVPNVVTDVGDSRLIVGNAGRVIPANDPYAMLGAWQQLVEIGAERRAEMGVAARRRIEELFGLQAVVQKYEQLYVKVVDEAVPHCSRPRSNTTSLS